MKLTLFFIVGLVAFVTAVPGSGSSSEQAQQSLNKPSEAKKALLAKLETRLSVLEKQYEMAERDIENAESYAQLGLAVRRQNMIRYQIEHVKEQINKLKRSTKLTSPQ